MEEIEYEWAQKYEIVKRIDAALLDGNGNHHAVRDCRCLFYRLLPPWSA